MGTRHELHGELKGLLGTTEKTGNEARCFYQPPESIKLTYPCIVYSRESPHVFRADNVLYNRKHHYGLIYITDDPDDALADAIETHFQMCRLTRVYVADNLNHYYYDLYY